MLEILNMDLINIYKVRDLCSLFELTTYVDVMSYFFEMSIDCPTIRNNPRPGQDPFGDDWGECGSAAVRNLHHTVPAAVPFYIWPRTPNAPLSIAHGGTFGGNICLTSVFGSDMHYQL